MPARADVLHDSGALHVRLPGDKSIAHRALLLAGLAEAPCSIENLPTGDDVRRTKEALVALGVHVTPMGRHGVHVSSAPWRSPSGPIDCGNSGTLARLLMGALAGQRVGATLVGDASLSARPMRRVASPLAELLGARVVRLTDAGTLPAAILPLSPPRRAAVVVDTGAPSAQVKSALLLGACNLEGDITVTEATPTRDHTERMLGALGVAIEVRGGAVRLRGPMRWTGFGLELPGDPSSAAFLAVAAAATGRPLVCEDLLLNPRRLGFLRVISAMGVQGTLESRGLRLGEVVGRVRICRGGAIVGAEVAAGEVPDLIDEVPALVALALLAQGPTIVPALAELRIKESDRLARLVDLAAAFGGRAEVLEDGLVVRAPATARGRVSIRTDGDHRVAMAAYVLGGVLGVDVELDVPGCEATSFPEFRAVLDGVLRSA